MLAFNEVYTMSSRLEIKRINAKRTNINLEQALNKIDNIYFNTVSKDLIIIYQLFFI